MSNIEFSNTNLVTYTCDRCGTTETPKFSGLDPNLPPPGWTIVNREQFYIYGKSGENLTPYKICRDCTARLMLWLMNHEEYDKFDENMLSIYRTCQHLKMHSWL